MGKSSLLIHEGKARLSFTGEGNQSVYEKKLVTENSVVLKF